MKKMNGLQRYHPCSMWNFEAIEALGVNLWPFSFGDSVWRLSLGAQPWERI